MGKDLVVIWNDLVFYRGNTCRLRGRWDFLKGARLVDGPVTDLALAQLMPATPVLSVATSLHAPGPVLYPKGLPVPSHRPPEVTH